MKHEINKSQMVNNKNAIKKKKLHRNSGKRKFPTYAHINLQEKHFVNISIFKKLDNKLNNKANRKSFL